MESIDEILAHVNDLVEGEIIDCMAKQCAGTDVTPRVLCIKLLGWLGARSRMKKRIPLELGPYSWCEALRASVANCPALSNLFIGDGNSLNFRPEIDNATIASIESAAATRYRPPLFTN